MTDHDEHQVGQPSESLILPKGLHQGGDVLLGVRTAHGQDGWLVGVPQVLTDLLQYQTFHVLHPLQCVVWSQL